MVLDFELICFDSLGVKSSCLLVKTADISILLEPGISAMHPTFPATNQKKQQWYDEGLIKIKETIKKSDVLVSSHYHLDHYISDDPKLFKNKTLLMKNPNEFINDKQRTRAENFYKIIYQTYQVDDMYSENKIRYFDNPLNDIPIARDKDYGEYQKRKNELMKKGQRWFENRVNNWNNNKQINQIKSKNLTVLFPENQNIAFGDTIIYCSKPLFHGIEYARLGWVFSTIIFHQGKKIMHTSDLCGPMIEDYAEFIIKQNPDILILDGPATYLFGYMLTRINLNRTIANTINIVEKTDTKIIIYDHHLCRDKRYKLRTKPVWDAAESCVKEVVTAAEYLGKAPVVLEN